jgi:tetratricopeptide (TPR) repeat protein
VTTDAVQQARALFDAGDFAAAREAALEALSRDPDDCELLRLAGVAGVELGADDAVDHLRRAVELDPRDARAWHELGDALATDGFTGEAAAAFRRALELDPDDEAALTALGHIEAAMGRTDSAIGHLADAARRTTGASTAAISLVEMYKSVGRPEEALAAAVQIADARPDDVLAVLDVAELSLDLGRTQKASSAYARLREIDDIPDHEVYSLYGLIRAEIHGGNWDKALKLAEQASRLDSLGSTGDVRAFLQARVSAAADGYLPARAELDTALAAAHAAHRRLHLEDRRLEAEDFA